MCSHATVTDSDLLSLIGTYDWDLYFYLLGRSTHQNLMSCSRILNSIKGFKLNQLQATACHIYVFISRNDRYSPIKLRSTTGLLYNFVTNQRLPIETLELHRGCPWDSMHINWGEVTLTNRDTKITLPYNVQIPIREKSRLHNLMKGSDYPAHLMVLQGCTWYTVGTTPLHYPAIQKPFSPGSMNPLPPSSDDGTA